MIEEFSYDKENDKILVIIGKDDTETAPPDVLEKIYKVLEDFDENKLFVFPDIIKKIVVIKGEVQQTEYNVSRERNEDRERCNSRTKRKKSTRRVTTY